MPLLPTMCIIAWITISPTIIAVKAPAAQQPIKAIVTVPSVLILESSRIRAPITAGMESR